MKLKPGFLLPLTSVGLLGVAGWTFLKAWPETRREAMERWQVNGVNDGRTRITGGHTKGPRRSGDWAYGESPEWWDLLKTANFTGKLPPTPPDPEPPPPPPSNRKPLDEIIELVVLFHDSKEKGKGGESHVVVRYKPGAFESPATPRPAAFRCGHDRIQKVWVSPANDGQRETQLWPPYDNIHLAQVAEDAQSAYFVRDLPLDAGEPTAAREEAPKSPEPERLTKWRTNPNRDLLRRIGMLER